MFVFNYSSSDSAAVAGTVCFFLAVTFTMIDAIEAISATKATINASEPSPKMEAAPLATMNISS